MLHQRIEAMWWSKQRSPNIFFRLLACMYQPLMKWDQKRRVQQRIRPVLPLIAVGNITVGGSGKTPFVAWLAQSLLARGLKPVILSRGDGANNQIPHLVTEYSQAHEVGDEAVLLFRLSGCPVVAGRDRVKGAEIAAEYGDVLILDDGFQYRQLQSACNIVMVPNEGVGNGYLLPAGPLREPVAALERADIVVRSGECEAISNKKEWIWSAKSRHIHAWNDTIAEILHTSTPIHVVTGIARPQRVLDDLEAMGFEVVAHTHFMDHHAYHADEIDILLAQPNPVVTTAKDAVKIQAFWPKNKPLWVLEQQPDAEPGLLEAILKCLQASENFSMLNG